MKLKGYENVDEATENITDPIVLEYFLDKQEELSNIKSNEEIANFKNFVNNEIDKLNNKINKAFETNELEIVLDNLKLLKFNIRLLEEINEKSSLH